ncbi:heavy-metal-associated domain-containing protein [Streptococcus agalactiae]
MKHTYRVSGMKCDGCAKTVSDKLSSVIGVDEVNRLPAKQNMVQ